METKLNAERRSDAGKGVARKLRAAGKIPAVLYGQGLDTTPLTVDSRELSHLLHGSAGSNVLVDLVVDGEEHLAIPREIQRDHIHARFVHVDFLAVSRTQTITVNVPVHETGEAVGVKEGGVVEHHLREVQIECLPQDVPDEIVDRHLRRRARRHGARERPRAAERRHDPHEPRGRRAVRRHPGRACASRPTCRCRARRASRRPPRTEAAEGEEAPRRRGRGRRPRGRGRGRGRRGWRGLSPSRAHDLAGRRPRQPRRSLREHPSQRRPHGRRRAGARPGARFKKARFLPVEVAEVREAGERVLLAASHPVHERVGTLLREPREQARRRA